MARINSNIPSLVAQENLRRANDNLGLRLERLSTGLRINKGADDPAGLIISERLRSEIKGIEQGIKNTERASNVIATTEGALAEVSDLLNSIKSLVVEASNTGAFSIEEIRANQRAIDSAVDSITRISNTSSFAGLKLLNGELGYRLSGVDESKILKQQINGANFLQREDVQVDVEVVGSAQQGQLFLRTDFSSNPPFGGTADGVLASSVSVEIAGPEGVDVVTFVSGQTVTDIIDAINARSAKTGVQAELAGGDVSSGVRFFTSDFGAGALASVKKLSGGEEWGTYKLPDNAPPSTLDWTDATTFTAADSDEGKDVVALVNGALATGNGLELSLRSSDLDVEFLLDETFATTVDAANAETFHITGGGALYQIGPNVEPATEINIGIQSVAASRLGGTLLSNALGNSEVQFLSSLKTGEFNSLEASRNRQSFTGASRILNKAIDEIATLRGRLGAFERNTLQTNVRSLQAGLENLTAAESTIRDADFAKETSELTRAQVLTSSSTTVLATANAQAQNVLQLLG
jgi:flagellin